MFDNIEQLEKQVHEFQNNILASNKLLADIESLTAAVKAQQSDYGKSSSAFIIEIKGYVKEVTEKSEALRTALSFEFQNINQTFQNTVTEITKSNTSVVDEVAKRSENLRSKLFDDLGKTIQEIRSATTEIKTNNREIIREAVNQLSSEISKLNTDTEKFIADLKFAEEYAIDAAVKKLTISQQIYIKQLVETQAAVTEMNKTINAKYQEFLQRLENTDFDQLFKTCQVIRNSLETKLYLILGGVGITGIIVVLSLFLK